MPAVIVKLRCPECQTLFRCKLGSADEPVPQDCPACGAAEERASRLDLDNPRAPVVRSNTARAVDEVWKIGQERYGLTDMRDDARPGETVAPKLTKDQQAMADGWDLGKQAAKPIAAAAGFGGANWLDVARNATAHDRATGGTDPLVGVMKGLKSQPAPFRVENTMPAVGRRR